MLFIFSFYCSLFYLNLANESQRQPKAALWAKAGKAKGKHH
jgi:hypothetical protein